LSCVIVGKATNVAERSVVERNVWNEMNIVGEVSVNVVSTVNGASEVNAVMKRNVEEEIHILEVNFVVVTDSVEKDEEAWVEVEKGSEDVNP